MHEQTQVKALTPKQQAFIENYLANGFNAVQAAIAAGYSEKTARSQGQRLLTNVDIAAEIERRLATRVMGSDEALQNLAEVARVDIADFLTMPGVFPYIDLDKAERLGKTHLIKKIKVRGDGGIEVELYDRQRANETVLRHLGLLKDGATFNFNFNISMELVLDTVKALDDAGVNVQEFFEKARARALVSIERQNALRVKND